MVNAVGREAGGSQLRGFNSRSPFTVFQDRLGSTKLGVISITLQGRSFSMCGYIETMCGYIETMCGYRDYVWIYRDYLCLYIETNESLIFESTEYENRRKTRAQNG